MQEQLYISQPLFSINYIQHLFKKKKKEKCIEKTLKCIEKHKQTNKKQSTIRWMKKFKLMK